MNTVIFRLFNSFGPGELPGKYRNVVPNFFEKAMAKEPLPIFGTGKETRDFNSVDNVVSALVAAMTTDKAIGQTFNIGSGKTTEINDIARMINEITGNPAGVTYLPRRDWDSVVNRCANIDKAREILNYEPVINLHKQLQTTYEWLKQHK
jgi:nucleoside-diphosphate-sugar epimerase